MSTALKERLYEIIFGHKTAAGRGFDIALIWMILLSVLCEVLDSVPELHELYGGWFFAFEWFFTICFTIEYIVRIYISKNRFKYIFSKWGVIDLLAIIPTYVALFFADAAYLVVVRLLRVLRVFRILKMVRYIDESKQLLQGLRSSARKIALFFFAVLVLAVLYGSVLYVVESHQNGFTSIPESIYWAIVTITTVGYGDIVPVTIIGKFIASLVMLTGYSIIAVPGGIFAAEMIRNQDAKQTPEKSVRLLEVCTNCHRGDHERDADYCRFCGTELDHSLTDAEGNNITMGHGDS